MRKILFRGKRKTGEWIDGSLVVSNGPVNAGRCYILPKFSDIRHGYGYELGDKIGGFYEVVPETVGQFTGLCDKNGKRIFEGDFVVCRQAINGNQIDELTEIGYVEMKQGSFGLHRKHGYYRPFKDWLEDYEYEVIGNIHDNPEMLEGGGEK